MDKKNQKKDFFLFIHFLRGIAPLLVLWAHLCGWWLSVNNTTSKLDSYWVTFIVEPFHLYQKGGHLGVLIFFLISGFVVTHASVNDNVKRFLVKRFFRIIPTLIIALLLMRIVVLIGSFYKLSVPLGNSSNELKEYFYTLFFLYMPLNRPAVLTVTWTLFIEVVFYLITAIFSSYTKKDPLRSTFYFICVLIVLVLIAPIHPVLRYSANMTVYILFILIGRVIYLGKIRMFSYFEAIVLGVTTFGCFILLYDYLMPNTLFVQSTAIIYSDIIAIIIFFLSMILFNKKIRVVSFFAEISYALYLVHIQIGSLVLNILTKNGASFKLGLASAIVASIIVAYIINRFVEIPAQKLARKIKFI
jgi:Predicted acyltransferases